MLAQGAGRRGSAIEDKSSGIYFYPLWFKSSKLRRSSAVERFPVKEWVAGSNPAAGALKIWCKQLTD